MEQILASTQIPWSLAASMAWTGGWLLRCLHSRAIGLGAAGKGSKRLFSTPPKPSAPSSNER